MVSTNYLVLVHFIICIACLCFILYTSLVLLFKRPKKNQTIARTPTVYGYFWFTTSASILLLINSAYILIYWRPEENIYNPTALYYIAGIPTIYVNFVPIADFFLCADRCFLVAFPLSYRRSSQLILAIIFGACIFGVGLTYILATRYFAFYTPDTRTSCVFYICLVFQLKYPMIMTYNKYVFTGLTAFAAGALLLLNYLRKNLQKEVSKKLNKSVLLLSFLQIAFTFVPTWTDDMVFRITGVHPYDVFGDYTLTLTCIDISICVWLYYRVFRRHFLVSSSVVVKVQNISSNVKIN